jgi:hypothetical protein
VEMGAVGEAAVRYVSRPLQLPSHTATSLEPTRLGMAAQDGQRLRCIQNNAPRKASPKLAPRA